jgi:hypothetical protein
VPGPHTAHNTPTGVGPRLATAATLAVTVAWCDGRYVDTHRVPQLVTHSETLLSSPGHGTAGRPSLSSDHASSCASMASACGSQKVMSMER